MSKTIPEGSQPALRRNANCQHALSPSLPPTSIPSRTLHCKSLPRLTRTHVAIFPFGVSHSSTIDMSPILPSFVSYISKSTKRMHSKSPSLSCNKIRLILRKESSAPSSLPGRLLTSGSLACLLLFRILGVHSVFIWRLFPLITSGYPFLPALIIFSTPIHLFGILRPSSIQARKIHRSSQCTRVISSAKNDSRARIASPTLFSPHPGFCTSTVPLTRHRRSRHSSLFSYLFVRLVPPPALAPNRTNSTLKAVRMVRDRPKQDRFASAAVPNMHGASVRARTMT
jgi:hypothetical protein